MAGFKKKINIFYFPAATNQNENDSIKIKILFFLPTEKNLTLIFDSFKKKIF